MGMPRKETPGKIHVKKGDTVLVLSGKDAGKRGKVLVVDRARQRVIVEGVNVTKRHTRPTRSLPQGGIIEKEGSIASSKVMLVCTKCQQPTRVGKKVLDNRRVRVCKRCGEMIDE